MAGRFVSVFKAYDEALDQTHRKNYSLLIQLAPNSLACTIFNTLNSKFLSLEQIEINQPDNPPDYKDALETFIDGHPWLNGEFYSVKVFYESAKSTLVPVSLFDPADLKDLSKFNFDVPENVEIRYDHLTNADAYLLYTVPLDVLQFLENHFTEHRLLCHASILVEVLLTLNKNQPPAKRMFVNVRNAQLDIVILEGKNLIFYNAFPYHSKQDFIYYIIFVIEQLNLNPEVIELHLSGMIDKKSTLYDIAWKYIRHIDFQTLPDTYRYSYLFNDVPPHQFFTLLNSGLCES